MFFKHWRGHNELTKRSQIDIIIVNNSCIAKIFLSFMIGPRRASMIIQYKFNKINSAVLLTNKNLLFLVEHPLHTFKLRFNPYLLLTIPFPITSYKYLNHILSTLFIPNLKGQETRVQRELNILNSHTFFFIWNLKFPMPQPIFLPEKYFF